MKRFLTLALVGALVLGVSSVVYANVCAFDAAPAATLLFPFVAYNYDLGYDGVTTLFSITNVSSEATIAHVTVWTDFSVAILDFNILLTGYDTQQINIRDILLTGQLPVTKIEGHAGPEGVNDDGPVSSANQVLAWTFTQPLDEPEATTVLSAAARCTTASASYPGKYSQPIPAQILELFKGWLQSSQTADRSHSDNCDFSGDYTLVPSPWWYERTTADDTWMYITVDVVQTCNKFFPDHPEYWTPYYLPNGEARYDNILIGDVIWVSQTDRLSEASTAVHIEADENLGVVATEGFTGYPVSFYHRYSAVQATVSDFREPLPTAWAFRYFGANPANSYSTEIRAWKGSSTVPFIRDLKFSPANESPSAMVATNQLAYTYYAWDEEENVLTTSTLPWSQPGGQSVVPNLLPLETQEVNVDQFNTVADSGWMLFVWPASNYSLAGPPPGCGDLYQTWMGVKFGQTGEYSAFTEGSVMANYNCFSQQMLQNGLGINFSYVDDYGYVISDGAMGVVPTL